MDPLFKTTLLRTLVFLLFLLLSPLLFVYVEYTDTDESEEKYKMLRILYESMTSKCSITIEEFNNFSKMAYEALSEPKPQWNYYHASDFAFQAFTTIGYGNTTPQTPAGQILCIFVCSLGIPITLLALKSIGELIAQGINKTVTELEKKILKTPKPKYIKLKSAVILFLLLILLFVINSLAITAHRNWTIIEGVYFWFITFTTIGFGDYILKEPKRIKKFSADIFKNNSKSQENDGSVAAIVAGRQIFFLIYFILCLCIVSSVINSIVAVITERKYQYWCPGCVPRKTKHKVNNETGKNQNVCDPVIMTNFRLENVQFHKENIEQSA